MQLKNNKDHHVKYIFVTGGVLSGLGKGVITSSIAKILQLTHLKVSCVKVDPYVNYDAGTMNPVAHGEVFVTSDGGECDMDIGNYERFLNIELTREHNLTTGRIYSEVIKDEREGKYLGQCVQIIPHVTDAIKNKLRRLSDQESLDVLVIECGGTVGDIESLPFLEAFRQMKLEEGEYNTLFVHVTLAPILDVVGEQKTKPTQHSVQELRRIGINPDILTVRCKNILSVDARTKISLFANINSNCVLSCHDVNSIFSVPEILTNQNIINIIADKLKLQDLIIQWSNWNYITQSFLKYNKIINIAVVGKYVSLPDSYVSVYQALSHAAAKLGNKLEVTWIDSEKFDVISKQKLSLLDKYEGILIPGGFGKRGSEGIINVANYAREENIPFLGICFGFQLSLVSFARNVCGIHDANSTELDITTKEPVVEFMPEQKHLNDLGGTMRLGCHKIIINPNTLASKIYLKNHINKRHRHRYEFNKNYLSILNKNGLILSGYSDNGKRTEILEIPDHKFYFAFQYHAEFDSRPGKPEQAFESFIKIASLKS
ncbi:MAG TPA: CTP synthase (glutamine hydrolyzing) [Nitrososphaeraceae archaeon]|nr:CTP synthase (glutamine hydrolyzing) [Nitrososphaeraceae archaeon]